MPTAPQKISNATKVIEARLVEFSQPDGVERRAIEDAQRALAMLGAAGVTPMETRVTEVTARVVELDRAPEAAVMVVEPTLTAVAIPLFPAVLLIDATVAAAELHVTDAVISCCEPSL